MRDFYRDIARTEVRHQELYIDLARLYFDSAAVDERLEALIAAETVVVSGLPVRPALY